MDPITLIVAALVTGAIDGLKPTAEQVVKDAYAGLKGLILHKFGNVSASVATLETNPQSKNKQASLREDLESTAAGQDEEVLRKAKEFIDLVQQYDLEAAKTGAAAIGVDIEHLRGATLNIEDIVAHGTGVRGKDWEFRSDVNIKGVRAGDKEKESPNL